MDSIKMMSLGKFVEEMGIIVHCRLGVKFVYIFLEAISVIVLRRN